MSKALLEQALKLVDPEFDKSGTVLKHNLNLKKRKSGGEGPQSLKKLSIAEARKGLKSRESIIEDNLKKIRKIREATTIQLDKKVTEQIIERAVTKRPLKPKKKAKKSQKTAFTEQDFKKFEEEYTG